MKRRKHCTTRIVKRIYPNNKVKYVIQQKHFLFRWLWVDAVVNRWVVCFKPNSFDSLGEAERNLCYFDNTKIKDSVVLCK